MSCPLSALGVGARVTRRQRLHRQRMDRTGKFFLQRGVHQALPRDAGQAFKCTRNDQDAKMRFTAFAGAGMTSMKVRFIDDLEPFRRERLRQFLVN